MRHQRRLALRASSLTTSTRRSSAKTKKVEAPAKGATNGASSGGPEMPPLLPSGQKGEAETTFTVVKAESSGSSPSLAEASTMGATEGDQVTVGEGPAAVATKVDATSTAREKRRRQQRQRRKHSSIKKPRAFSGGGSGGGGSDGGGRLSVPSASTAAADSRRRAEDRLAVVSMGFILVFLCCHSLRLALDIHELLTLEAANACRAAGRRGVPTWALCAVHVSHILLVLNAATNILVYCGLSSRFREEFCRAFGGVCGMGR